VADGSHQDAIPPARSFAPVSTGTLAALLTTIGLRAITPSGWFPIIALTGAGTGIAVWRLSRAGHVHATTQTPVRPRLATQAPGGDHAPTFEPPAVRDPPNAPSATPSVALTPRPGTALGPGDDGESAGQDRVGSIISAAAGDGLTGDTREASIATPRATPSRMDAELPSGAEREPAGAPPEPGTVPEIQLPEPRSLVAALVDTADEGILIGPHGVGRDMPSRTNAALAQVWGIQRETLLAAHDPWTLLTPYTADPEAWTRRRAEIDRHGEPSADIVPLQDGRVLHVSSVPVSGRVAARPADATTSRPTEPAPRVWRCRDLTRETAMLDRVRTHERYVALLVDHAPHVVVLLTPEGRVQYASRAVESLLGIDAATLEQATPAAALAFVRPSDRLRLLRGFGRARVTPADSVTVRFRVQRADATCRDVEARIWNAEHEPAIRGVLINVRDCTAEHVAAAAVDWARALTRATLDASHEGLIALGDDGSVVINRAGQTMWRIPDALLHPADAQTATRVLHWCQQQIASRDQGVRMFEPAGIVEAQVSIEDVTSAEAVVLELHDGRQIAAHAAPHRVGAAVVGRVIATQDVTETRRLERSLRAGESRYRRLFDENPQPMWVYDLETLQILTANAAASRHYGYPGDMLRTMRVSDLSADGAPPANGERYGGGYWQHLTAAGDVIDVELVSHEISYAGRRARLVNVEDVTDRNRAAAIERQLREAERLAAVGEIASMVVHEVANPLGSVITLTQVLLQTPGALSEDARADLVLVEQEATRAATTLHDMLSLARRDPIAREGVDMNAVAEKVLATRAAALRNGAITVDREFTPALPSVLGHRHQLEAVLLNLIINAEHAMRPQHAGRLTIRTAREADRVCVEVTDSGLGIPEDVMPRIFEMFYSTKTDGEGTGLGLAVTRQIVRDTGGDVVATNAPDAGARFTILLPIAPQTPTPNGD
jgi:PAS domain S-box-containing protein